MGFNRDLLKNRNKSRYLRQLQRTSENFVTNNIECVVDSAVKNITNGERSFVIYGEPQSGKTEMMIILTAKLLDIGYKIIIILLNDNVQLLQQNLDRFKRSSLDPAPKNFDEILDPSINIKGTEWIIFCKKNSKDLTKLMNKIGSIDSLIILDDEADYASPNSKINIKGEKTKINELVGKLLTSNSIYIGITATPGRLDLNNTFNNTSEAWIKFSPPMEYTGHEDFFPIIIGKEKYDLIYLPENDDSPKYLRNAFFEFLMKASYVNLYLNKNIKNYCFLIHTSGKKDDHKIDYLRIEKIIDVLTHNNNKKHEVYIDMIWNKANDYFENSKIADDIILFIYDHMKQNQIVVINSDQDKEKVRDATSPSTLFTIAIGGNIVSRGVTFENLLVMFFTRDVKNKIQQDTYIQRARMFGYRREYLRFFTLFITESLYLKWHTCFVYQKLSLELISHNEGIPYWIEDKKSMPVAKASINKSITSVIGPGSTSFGLFQFQDDLHDIISNEMYQNEKKLVLINKIVGDEALPLSFINFILKYSTHPEQSIAIHMPQSIDRKKDADPDTVYRTTGGMFANSDYKFNKYPHAFHHLKIFFSHKMFARVYYSYAPGDSTKYISKKRKAA